MSTPIHGMNRETGKGPYRTQSALWKASLAVGQADLVYKEVSDHYDKSAAQFTWNSSLAQTQTDFKAVFRGVSACRRTTAQTADGSDVLDGPILSSGEFWFPCTALAAALYVAANSYVTIDQGVGNTLNPAQVIATTNVSLAIGRLTRDAAVGATGLYFEIMPATTGNGVAAVS